MLANQASSTPPTTAASSDQVMQDGAGRLWTSLGQAPGLQMAWRRLPAFRSDMERRSVVSLIVALAVRRQMGVSALPHQKMLRSIELLGTRVAPNVRKQLTTVLSRGVF